MECDEATCMICNEVGADNGPILGIFGTNCQYQCRQCALCDEAKAKGLSNEVAKCEKYCAGEFLLVPEIVCKANKNV